MSSLPDEEPAHIDGGLIALSGYLYQAIGHAGLLVHARRTSPVVNNDDLEALIKLTQRSDYTLNEQGGEDVVLHLDVEGNSQITLVQFKFTMNPRGIFPGKLKEIVKRLKQNADGFQGVSSCGYALVSNNDLSPGAKQIRQDAQSDRDVKGLTAQEREVLKRLDVVPRMALRDWYDGLSAHAKKFGLFADEIRASTDRIVGRLNSDPVTGNSTLVTLDWITQMLTQCDAARPLLPAYVAPVSLASIERFGDENADLIGAPVRRALLQKITDACRRSPFVVLVGEGGSGKTVGLWHWLKEMNKTNPEDFGAFVHIQNGADLERDVVRRTICEWGNISHDNTVRSSENADRAYSRLATANRGISSPLIHFGIDGLDEYGIATDRSEHIKSVVRWFWRDRERPDFLEPQRVLVATCRDPEVVFMSYLSSFSTAFRNPINESDFIIRVEDFNIAELREAAYEGLSEEQANLVARSLPPPEITDFDTEIAAMPFANEIAPAPSNNDRRVVILKALRHPVMWRALLELASQHGDAKVSAVLEGEDSAIDELARLFLFRFVGKALRRLSSRFPNQLQTLRDDMHYILNRIGRHVAGNGGIFDRERDWYSPLRQDGRIEHEVVKALYYEALSGGIVKELEPGRWIWRHELVGNFLGKA